MRKAIELYNIGSWRVPEALCQFEMQFNKRLPTKVTISKLMRVLNVFYKQTFLEVKFDNVLKLNYTISSPSVKALEYTRASISFAKW